MHLDVPGAFPTSGQIAKQLGTTRDRVQYAKRKLGLQPQRAGDNGPFVFNADEVSQITEAIGGTDDLAGGELNLGAIR